MFSLAVSYDTDVNTKDVIKDVDKDVNTNLLDNCSEMTEFCPRLLSRRKETFSERLLKEVDFKIGEKWSDDFDVK